MKIYLIFTVIACAIFTLGSDDVFTTTTTSDLTSSISHGQRIRGFSSAFATPLPLPEWELKNRDRWIATHNGRPRPNEDGYPQPVNMKHTKNTEHSKRAAAPTRGATNILFVGSGENTQYASGATHTLSATTPLVPGITTGPHLSHRELLRRQAAGPLYIPYIPADWTTITQCPAVAGLPCTTVSQYIPFFKQEAARASKEAARASSLANNGAFVPGMKVPAAARIVEAGLDCVIAIFVMLLWLL